MLMPLPGPESGGAIQVMLAKKGRAITCWIIMVLDDTIYREPYQDRTTNGKAHRAQSEKLHPSGRAPESYGYVKLSKEKVAITGAWSEAPCP
jgi:hypothetical protein